MMKMNFEIITADPDALKLLIPLWLEFIRDEEGSDMNIVPSRENAERWISFVKNLIEKDRGTLKYAKVDEKIVGYILYGWENEALKLYHRRGTIFDLYVIKEYRGRGIGKKLLNTAIEDLKHHGIEIIQLTVINSNKRAIELYKKFGFEERLKILRLELKG